MSRSDIIHSVSVLSAASSVITSGTIFSPSMPVQGIQARKGAVAVGASKWFFSCMQFLVSLEIMHSTETRGTSVTLEYS